MHIDSSAAATRYRRWLWLLGALIFAATAGMQVYLAISMTAWWAWAVAAVLAVISLACVLAAFSEPRPQ
ncbi:hypothetical protein [Amycolatopsis pithecellobii]|uniref:DUF4175 domain-containing protein n=1 Tax=Amycolatopsis pithecellobii TaxID=664692 RepID=A0A6N7Z601_9PSEU|nr:hypothetical protein [Amycolatopsis pithecellobii]MTD54896.1 hypothetical protein [Amycolatopsis pithecellobii]